MSEKSKWTVKKAPEVIQNACVLLLRNSNLIVFGGVENRYVYEYNGTKWTQIDKFPKFMCSVNGDTNISGVVTVDKDTNHEICHIFCSVKYVKYKNTFLVNLRVI